VPTVLFLRGHRYCTMRTPLVLLGSALVLGAACSSNTTSNISNGPAAASVPRTIAPPSPTASTPSNQAQFAVIFTSSGPAAPGGSILTIVGEDGRSYGQTRIGDDVSPPPFASTTSDAVYYLNGQALMRLQPGGTPVHVRDIPGSSNVRTAFAVSPDDKRIAIAVLTFATTSSSPSPTLSKYLGMKMFVEDLNGSNHADIFSSATVAEWPVGWHGSDLVIAVGAGAYGFGGSLIPGPYFAAAGIHVADSATGQRKATLCGGLPAVGLGTSKGILCAKGNGVGPTTITPVPMAISDWSGKEIDLDLSCINGGLQPAGDDIACDTNGGGFVVGPGGERQSFPTPSGPAVGFGDSYSFVGWVGHDHLLLWSRAAPTVLYDIETGTSQQVDLRPDAMIGAIPGGL
jgi:hypothetical protein